jgi:hypothetical protein
MEIIRKKLTVEYWRVNEWLEGRIKEVPDLLSQGRTIEELEQNLRDDCADLVSDTEYARQRGYSHLDAADIHDAELTFVELDRFHAANAQLFVLSPDRREKVFAYIEDLVDLESLERRADDEDARRGREQGGEEEEEW